MVNMYFVFTLVIVLNYLPAWTIPRVRHSKLCLFRRFNLAGLTDRQRELLENAPQSVGPKRTKKYDPSFGYEQYWPGGNWVYEPVEKKEGDMCGSRCSKVMKRYGKVCGRDKEFNHQTFENYCYLKNHDCNGTQGWLAAYRGECKNEVRTLPTAALEIFTRALQWISAFSAKTYPY